VKQRFGKDVGGIILTMIQKDLFDQTMRTIKELGIDQYSHTDACSFEGIDIETRVSYIRQVEFYNIRMFHSFIWEIYSKRSFIQRAEFHRRINRQL